MNRLFPVLLLLLFPLASCNALAGLGLYDPESGQPPLVAQAIIEAETETGGRPTMFAAWNGDTFCGWAAIDATFSVAPLLHREVSAGRAVVRVKSTDFDWEGSSADDLPAEAFAVITDIQAGAWGLTEP